MLATLTVVLAAAPVGGPATAAPEAPVDYVAIGDSYASGFGAGSYTECGRSPLGLPGLLDATSRVELTADATCAGATAAVVPGGAVDVPEQIAGLTAEDSLDAGTDLVTLSVGGNDAGFGVVAGLCATEPLEACRRAIQRSREDAETTVASSLDAVYAQLGAAAPNANVVVTGYPHLFSPGFSGPAPFPAEAQLLFNDATDVLNRVIESRATAAGFTYVDVVDEFAGHGVGSPDPWITFTGSAAPDDLHPTAAGYREGYFRAVRCEANLARLRK
ncbi:SGNH/GDSL hydrolase family protein [Arthrobacter sp. TMN-37]